MKTNNADEHSTKTNVNLELFDDSDEIAQALRAIKPNASAHDQYWIAEAAIHITAMWDELKLAYRLLNRSTDDAA